MKIEKIDYSIQKFDSIDQQMKSETDEEGNNEVIVICNFIDLIQLHLPSCKRFEWFDSIY